jgi:protocatechuate 3,4-dioxygenase beta subunit
LRKYSIVLFALASLCLGASEPAHEPVVGLPCEGCEAVFQGMPLDIPSASRIAPAGEPGEPLRIEGTVRDLDGRPAAGIVVYAYHTNARGIYPRSPSPAGPEAARHGLLRGWAKTDAQGRYRFDTIRPGGYPDADVPQHVHMHVIEPGRCTYDIDEALFDDDPRLTKEMRRNLTPGRGGSGITTPRREAGGRWVITRDIVLGEKIPGYPR